MESTSRPSRLSRIAKPANTTRRLFYESDAFRRESNMMNRLSVRSTTPTRTPSMSNQMVTSGQKKPPPTEDRKLIQNYIHEITNHVKNIKELGKDFITKGGLRSMTVREFVIIINYFMKQINPKANFTANYSDELFQYLTQYNYPYSVNKGWFKTPNAPHSFSHIVIMLRYLLRFLPMGDDEEEDHIFDTIDGTKRNDKLPSIQFTNEFNRKVMDGYSVWDRSQEQEFSELKLQIETQLIKASHGNFKINNKSEMENQIANLKSECEELYAKRVPKPNVTELMLLKNQLEAKRTENEELLEKIRITQITNEKITKDIKDLEKEMEFYGPEEKRLKSVIQKQSREKLKERFESMKQEIDKLSWELKGKTSLMDQMNANHYNKMLNHTKNVNQKLVLQNDLLVKLIDLKEVEEMKNILNLSDIDGNCVFTVDLLETLKSKLISFNSSFLQSNQEEAECLMHEIREMKDFKVAYQEGILQNLEDKVDELNENMKTLQADIVEKSLNYDKRMLELKDQKAQLESQISQLKEVEEKKKQELNDIELQKEEIMDETMKKIKYIKAEREKNFNEFKKVAESLSAFIEETMSQLDDL